MLTSVATHPLFKMLLCSSAINSGHGLHPTCALYLMAALSYQGNTFSSCHQVTKATCSARCQVNAIEMSQWERNFLSGFLGNFLSLDNSCGPLSRGNKKLSVLICSAQNIFYPIRGQDYWIEKSRIDAGNHFRDSSGLPGVTEISLQLPLLSDLVGWALV